MKLLLIAGARPNFMKIAPICRVLRAKSIEHGAPVKQATRLTGQAERVMQKLRT
jgi:UDP-N-acetylglucosamine 2-epimerase